MNRLTTIFIWASLIVSFLTSIWFVLHGTIYFHTDIARDFLLIEDIVVNRKLTLIGPHSGGIEGVFHGPAWLYLNLPAFIIGGGNPVVVGWFWSLLVASSIGIVYFATKKLSDTKAALMAAALYGLTISGSASNLFNPFGAVLLAPLFFYYFILYLSKHSFIHLLISLFLIGIIIQFQMAWGVPILILSVPLLFHHFFIHKKLLHISSFLILLLPLSTFLLFDIRHEFLQIRSVLAYLSQPKIIQHASTLQFVWGRMLEMGLGNILVALLLLIFVTKLKKNRAIKYFLYFYFGYFFITLIYKGTLWGYYTIPFTPLFCMAVAIALNSLPKKWGVAAFIVIVSPLFFVNIKTLLTQDATYFKNNSGLWHAYLSQANTIYTDAKGSDFGWYVYSADQYGYSPKYAMRYVQKQSKNNGFAFEKKPITYLIISPSTNKYTNEKDWKKDKIYLTRKPDKVIRFVGGMYVEKYMLSAAEQKVPAANDLIEDLMFR